MHNHAILINNVRQAIVFEWSQLRMRLVPFADYCAEIGATEIMAHPIRGQLSVASRCRYDADVPVSREGDTININAETVMMLARDGMTEAKLRNLLSEADDADRAWRDFVLGSLAWTHGMMQVEGSA
ncbi:hypothetical protein SAMN05518801_104241 [Novosphingobium sp. CF614]|uniref:hypothetical protein n=1 Tax=Novosphingobium sp. CF614 TaxID=1884364 RepID=UPI0008EF4137|nr:hypothetical protein [Novosphingobium sp. CF614]SFF96961.1 hypothetical protein SAMN05518801_104241 [Novosphingobium sp. CF614]